MLELAQASQLRGVLAHQRDQLGDELWKADELPAREVQQLPIDAVAHRAPAVLGDEHVGIDAPAAVVELQPIEPPRE